MERDLSAAERQGILCTCPCIFNRDVSSSILGDCRKTLAICASVEECKVFTWRLLIQSWNRSRALKVSLTVRTCDIVRLFYSVAVQSLCGTAFAASITYHGCVLSRIGISATAPIMLPTQASCAEQAAEEVAFFLLGQLVVAWPGLGAGSGDRDESDCVRHW